MTNLYRLFIKGFLTVFPLTLTVYLLIWVASVAEDFFGQPLRQILPDGFYIAGLGVAVGFAVVLAIGFLVNNYFTSQLFSWLESSLTRVPLIKVVYSPLRDIMNLFSGDRNSGMQRVVMVRLAGTPEQPTEVLGLVTRDSFADLPKGLAAADGQARRLTVYIPLSYAMGGLTVVVSPEVVREAPISAQQAMQLSITAWIKTRKSEHPPG